MRFESEDQRVVRQSVTLLLDAIASPEVQHLFVSTLSVDGVTDQADVKISTKEQTREKFTQFMECLFSNVTRLLQMQTPRGPSPATLPVTSSESCTGAKGFVYESRLFRSFLATIRDL